MTLKDQQFLLPAVALQCTPELCVPCGFAPLPFWLALSKHGATYCFFFQRFKRLLSLLSSHGWFFSQSTNPFSNFPRLDAGVQNVSRTNSAGIFQPKKVNLTSHFRTAFFFFLHASEQCEKLSFSCRVNIIYLSNN